MGKTGQISSSMFIWFLPVWWQISLIESIRCEGENGAGYDPAATAVWVIFSTEILLSDHGVPA